MIFVYVIQYSTLIYILKEKIPGMFHVEHSGELSMSMFHVEHFCMAWGEVCCRPLRTGRMVLHPCKALL